MDTIIWNVKNADTLYGAVSNMRHWVDCKESLQSITKCKPFGHTIDARRKLNEVLLELSKLAADEVYREHGLTLFNQACEKYFTIAKRRGYVVLTLKME